MSVGEYLEFGFFFFFLFLWTAIALLGALYPERTLKTPVLRDMWRGAPRSKVRLLSVVFLIVGVVFLSGALGRLASGTFKWAGRAKTYSFSDFLK